MFGIRRYFQRRKFRAVAVKVYQRTRHYPMGRNVVDEIPITFYENENGDRKVIAHGIESQPRPEVTIAVWLAGGPMPEDVERTI